MIQRPARAARLRGDRALDPSAVVFGPATFLNQFAIQANELLSQQQQATIARAQQAALQAARQAKKAGLSAAEQQQAGLAAASRCFSGSSDRSRTLACEYGQTGPPRLDDPGYVSSVICDDRFPGCVPKARFSAIVPSSDAALISVRLRPGLSESERREAISLFRDAVADPSFRLQKGSSGHPAQLRGQRRPGRLRGAGGGALHPDLHPRSRPPWRRW